MTTVLPTWPCALTRPGITVFPVSATRRAPAGTVTLAADPTETIRPLRTRIVALSIGARSVPSITRAQVKAVVVDAGCCAGVPTDQHATAAQAMAKGSDFMAPL